MPDEDNFLHTTHRTVTWFNKTFQRSDLELSAPFQRNPVWTNAQKAYLIDTILHGLPVPELYMQDTVDESGDEKHIVVDGQQRIRACLDFVAGNYRLAGDDVTTRWRGLKFDDLSPGEKQKVYAYKFVIRILPQMDEIELRKIFARLNRNVVALNDQELRNATYWGPFIKTIQYIADDDPFWADSGIFSANDHRRMLDHEYISELAVAYLHGLQNKKDKLETYYQLYEEEFEAQQELVTTFKLVTGEISQLLPEVKKSRWAKKSDFYTLFLSLTQVSNMFPLTADNRALISGKIIDLGNEVDQLLRLDEQEWSNPNQLVTKYARNVSRAASDRSNRSERFEAFNNYVFPKTE